jgi:hypothetical protein
MHSTAIPAARVTFRASRHVRGGELAIVIYADGRRVYWLNARVVDRATAARKGIGARLAA